MPCRILTLQSEAQWPLLGDMLAGRYDPDDAVEPVVRDILAAVRSKGDEALAEYTRRFDCPDFTPRLTARHLRRGGAGRGFRPCRRHRHHQAGSG